MPSKVYEYIKWDNSPMQPCTIIKLFSSLSCMACNYIQLNKSVKTLINSVHISWYSWSCRVIKRWPWWKCIFSKRNCWGVCVTMQARELFCPPHCTCIAKPRPEMTTKHVTDRGKRDFTTRTQQFKLFCSFVFPKSHLQWSLQNLKPLSLILTL